MKIVHTYKFIILLQLECIECLIINVRVVNEV
jgi:hypothetical protein